MGIQQYFPDKLNNDFGGFLTLIVGLSTFFTILLIVLPKQYEQAEDRAIRYVDDDGAELEKLPPKRKEPIATKLGWTVQIVVLGDIGRSPRMQYHALSIAKYGGKVFLIGYQESEIHPDIVSSPFIQIIPLTPAPKLLRSSSKLLFPILAPLKVLWQIQSLFFALGYHSPPSRFMFVQNPPSIPTLAVAWLMCFLRNTELVIDWHNFGYSILALKLGPAHPLVKISAWYEKLFARAASQHITVTHAMARVLKTEYGVTAKALHDRPADMFRPISPAERLSFLSRLSETSKYASHICDPSKTPWKLLVSSTSWTADEDFSLLLRALVTYSSTASETPHLPRLLAIITGKGPQKAHYLSEIARLTAEKKLANVTVLTAWLTAPDYALLLASADLGVSLHTSSSGVDLPMKVVDMFGAGLPVVGWGAFEAWPELVREGENGIGFSGAEELAMQLGMLFGEDATVLARLKEGAMKESGDRWEGKWEGVGRGVFDLKR